jgi:hypothetical protein
LELLQEGVRRQTEYEGVAPKNNSGGDKKEKPETTSSSSTVAQQASRARVEPRGQKNSSTPEERMAEQRAKKGIRENARTAQEEMMGGRKEGRERQIEKRRETSQRIHGSAKDREEARLGGGVELSDAAIYGGRGGTMNFESAVARERERTANRQEKKNTRMEELQQKEKDRQENMLKVLGLSGLVTPGQKITIAPRKDGL